MSKNTNARNARNANANSKVSEKKQPKTKKAVELNAEQKVLADAIVEALAGHEGTYTARDFGVAIKAVRMAAKESNFFKARAAGGRKAHVDPGYEMGDVVTIEVTKKGEKKNVTGRFVDWNARTGKTRVMLVKDGNKIVKGRALKTKADIAAKAA